jgi:hypothetical protein
MVFETQDYEAGIPSNRKSSRSVNSVTSLVHTARQARESAVAEESMRILNMVLFCSCLLFSRMLSTSSLITKLSRNRVMVGEPVVGFSFFFLYFFIQISLSSFFRRGEFFIFSLFFFLGFLFFKYLCLFLFSFYQASFIFKEEVYINPNDPDYVNKLKVAKIRVRDWWKRLILLQRFLLIFFIFVFCFLFFFLFHRFVSSFTL